MLFFKILREKKQANKYFYNTNYNICYMLNYICTHKKMNQTLGLLTNY
jgi:hypothetical protein